MEKLNKYEIEGRTYQAVNEHEAVKAAYKMAKNYSLKKYIGNDVWVYDANFSNGKAEVIVRRIVSHAASLGSIKSPRKAASSRENGKKGGRPIKNQYRARVTNQITGATHTTRRYATFAEAHAAGERLAKRDVYANCAITILDNDNNVG